MKVGCQSTLTWGCSEQHTAPTSPGQNEHRYFQGRSRLSCGALVDASGASILPVRKTTRFLSAPAEE